MPRACAHDDVCSEYYRRFSGDEIHQMIRQWILCLVNVGKDWPASLTGICHICIQYDTSSRRLSDMKYTGMIWRSWVWTPVGSNLGCIVLLSKVILEPKMQYNTSSSTFTNLARKRNDERKTKRNLPTCWPQTLQALSIWVQLIFPYCIMRKNNAAFPQGSEKLQNFMYVL